MTNKVDLRIGTITTMISNINNVQIQLATAAGAVLMVELRMRLIGEHSQAVRGKLAELVNDYIKKNPKRKRPSDKYWDCKLSFLDDAIAEIFKNQLDLNELQKMDRFRDLRNALMHADFVSLLKELGLAPEGRQIMNPYTGNRNILTNAEIKESVLSVSSDRTRGLQIVETEAKTMTSILDRLLISLAIP